MERATAAGILVAIPVFGLVFIAGLLLSRVLRRDYYTRPLDAVASLTSGLWNVTIAGTELAIRFISYELLLEKLHVVSMGSTIYAFIVTFVLMDFGFYWFHRAQHTYNFLWQTHLQHHAGEQMNVASSVRLGGTPFSLRFLLLIPIALLGVSAPIVFLVTGLQFVGSSWYHTRFLKEMGPLGKVFVTPGFHRVHHGINRPYIDRNFSAMFSVWDRMFGTYQAELPDEPVVVGLTRPVRTYNPLRIDYQHWWQMVKDSARAEATRDKVKIWFSRTNWRPDDVRTTHPIAEVSGESVHGYQAFEPYADRLATGWSLAELLVQAMLTLAMFWAIYQGRVGGGGTALYAGLLLLSIVTYTTAMDGRPHRLLAVLRLVAFVAFGVALAGADWFGIGASLAPVPVTLLLLAFFAAAIVMPAFARRSPAPPLVPSPIMAAAD